MEDFEKKVKSLREGLEGKLSQFNQDIEYFVVGKGRDEVDSVVNLTQRGIVSTEDLKVSLSDKLVFDIEGLALHYSPSSDFDGENGDFAYTLCRDPNQGHEITREINIEKLEDEWSSIVSSDIDAIYSFLENQDIDPLSLRVSIEERLVEIYSGKNKTPGGEEIPEGTYI